MYGRAQTLVNAGWTVDSRGGFAWPAHHRGLEGKWVAMRDVVMEWSLASQGQGGCEWEKAHPFVSLIARLAALRDSASHG